MPQFVVVYLAIGIVFFALDFCWLAVASGRLYRPRLGSLLTARPRLEIAGLFYLLYVAGIALLAVMPNANNEWWMTSASGALLGLVAYGTYDFTNLATLRGWSVAVTVADLAWGTALTALGATAGHLALALS